MLSPRLAPSWAPLADVADLHEGDGTLLLSRVTEIAAAIDTVLQAMTGLGYSAKDHFGVRLALEEAVVNSIKHGHQHDPAKMVVLRYRVGTEYVLLEVEDQGAGFDPAQVPDPTDPESLERPSGRGLLLIQFSMSWVGYNERGNCVTFCKFPSEPLPCER